MLLSARLSWQWIMWWHHKTGRTTTVVLPPLNQLPMKLNTMNQINNKRVATELLWLADPLVTTLVLMGMFVLFFVFVFVVVLSVWYVTLYVSDCIQCQYRLFRCVTSEYYWQRPDMTSSGFCLLNTVAVAAVSLKITTSTALWNKYTVHPIICVTIVCWHEK